MRDARQAVQNRAMAAWPRRPEMRRRSDLWVAVGMIVFVVGVYVVVVLGGGALIGRTDSPHVGLSVLATAAVALGFEPVRTRLQRAVAPSPYDVLARFAAGVEAGVRDDDVLARMACLLSAATGAVQAQVWLRRSGDETLAACWPPGGAPLPVAGPDIRTHDVRHHAEVLGRVTLQARPGHLLTPLEGRLFADLARRSGLVLRNVRLTTQLHDRVSETAARVAELRASRRRVVCAHDDARRRVERDIHDGAQQHLVALAVTLRLARNLAERDRAAAEKMLPDLRDAMDQTVATLTELSSGLYPRVLAEHGLAEALSHASRMSAVPVRVRADGVGRYSPELEAAVYFCCLEAVQNRRQACGRRRGGRRHGGQRRRPRVLRRRQRPGFRHQRRGRHPRTAQTVPRLPGWGRTVRDRVPRWRNPRRARAARRGHARRGPRADPAGQVRYNVSARGRIAGSLCRCRLGRRGRAGGHRPSSPTASPPSRSPRSARVSRSSPWRWWSARRSAPSS
jgi:signal transduction histidine kinase